MLNHNHVSTIVALLVSHSIVQVTGQCTLQSAQNATAFSILYGYPLSSYIGAIEPIIKSVGVNALQNNRYLETANEPGSANQVVDPNEDTVYSAMVFDLAEQDVAITVPDVPKDRFALWSYYDPFGDNFANTGTQNLDEPGEYLLRHDPSRKTYGVTKAEDCGDEYVAYVDSPTTFGIMDIRWLVYNYSSYDDIHRWQNETKIRTVPKPPSQYQNTTLLQVLKSVPQTTHSTAVRLLQLLAAFAPWCPPTVVSDRKRVNSLLARAGIANGTYTPPTGVNYTSANLTALELAANSFDVPGRVITETNGWTMLAPNITGNYNTAYGVRTSIAITGYLALAAPNALYPTFNNGTETGGLNSATSFQLGPDESLLYTFSGRPPIKVTGFWSLTAYENNLLIPNPLNRSSLGDRSNLTFPDGQLVYSMGGIPTDHEDGEFQILIQPADIAPPANWTSNWLPAPAGGASKLSVLLRWYDGELDQLVSGPYVYPEVFRGGVIKGVE